MRTERQLASVLHDSLGRKPNFGSSGDDSSGKFKLGVSVEVTTLFVRLWFQLDKTFTSCASDESLLLFCFFHVVMLTDSSLARTFYAP